MMASTSLEKSAETISSLFLRYKVEDIATSLFVSSVWLPNIASPLKHLFFTAILSSLNLGEFSNSDAIADYNDFQHFLGRLFALSPSFPALEDYVPETDWGDVKFHHEGENYKIFYGNELECVYDYLSLFQVFYRPYEKEYQECCGRSPVAELRYCLQLQDQIISGIDQQPTFDKIPGLAPGYIEIPPPPFWGSAATFCTNYKPPRCISKSFLDRFTVRFGGLKKDFVKKDNFADMFFSGELLPAFFLSNDDTYFPILPRRYSAILLDDWAKVFQGCYSKLVNNGVPYFARIATELYRYTKKRINTSNLFRFVGAVTDERVPHEVLFSIAFISRNKLMLIYVPDPTDLAKLGRYDLTEIAPKLNEALRFISTPPVTLAAHLDRQNIEFRSDSNQAPLEPELIVAIPQVSTWYMSVSIPSSLPCRATSLRHLLGILDELENVDLLASFTKYLETHAGRFSPMASLLDKFASFQDSYGVLISGAAEPHFIMLDPHWGSNRRYASLVKFWKTYPEVDFFDEPRSWTVTQETSTRTRLAARGYLGLAIYLRIGQTHIFLTAPFHAMSFEQGQITDLLMQCIEDSMSRLEAVFLDHQFFEIHNRFHVNCFPQSLVSSDERFKHLQHLKSDGENWRSDIGYIKKGIPAIRLVFNEKTARQAFMDATDSSLEIDLLLEILSRLNDLVPDSKLDPIKKTLSRAKSAKPRFKMFQARKVASFPEFIQTHEPTTSHFKLAKKRIAELAGQLKIAPGSYETTDAKTKLNSLRDSIVRDIDSAVAEYAFEKAIPYLIARIDALTHKYERSQAIVKHALEHDVDYNRGQIFAKQQSEYSKMHKNYRYLIEKFIQLQPEGQQSLKKDVFQYLVALIDWLQVVYQASDNIHYGILHPVRIVIGSDYVVDVEYENDIELKQEVFAEEQSKLELGLVGNPVDRVDSPRPLENLLAELDEAFKQDLGFGLKSMVNVLQILTRWAEYSATEENVYYCASLKEIKEVCLKNIIGIDQVEVEPILKFLTLRSYDVIRILNQHQPCKDLPVWEHRKRYARYTLRPLILIGKHYYWGPYSTMKTGIIWSGYTSSGTLPFDLQSTNIQRVIDEEKRLIEDNLVTKASEIVNRYTTHTRREVDLRKVNKRHPVGLGDYDVLAYFPKFNVVLSIECKDILPPYCLKDAKRLKEKIFGKPGKGRGFFEKITRRQSYLSTNLPQIAGNLKWPIDINNLPSVVNVFLSRRTYWWTRYPPDGIEAVFLRVDQLSNYIEDLAD